eukprot:2410336-Rhodomonas_salina.1
MTPNHSSLLHLIATKPLITLKPHCYDTTHHSQTSSLRHHSSLLYLIAIKPLITLHVRAVLAIVWLSYNPQRLCKYRTAHSKRVAQVPGSPFLVPDNA